MPTEPNFRTPRLRIGTPSPDAALADARLADAALGNAALAARGTGCAGVVALAVWVAACGAAGPAAGPSPEQDAFWDRLREHCGQAYEGRLIEAPPEDGWWDARRLVMHVRECADAEIRIPLHVDDDRSRTWVVTKTGNGLRLKHDHRQRDGTPDATNTDYGGDTRAPGSAGRQEFPADEYSVGVVPARASQHWYLEIEPGEAFVYGLLRAESGLRYRVEFDLTRPVAPPPPPWGWEEEGA